jgi:hypothetical protein
VRSRDLRRPGVDPSTRVDHRPAHQDGRRCHGGSGVSVATIDEWCNGWLELPPEAEARLHLADTILGTFDDHEVPEPVSLVWFTTPNLSLGGRTPASAMGNGEPTDVAPALLVAARASIN